MLIEKIIEGNMNLGNQSESKNILTLENVEKNVDLLDLFVISSQGF